MIRVHFLVALLLTSIALGLLAGRPGVASAYSAVAVPTRAHDWRAPGYVAAVGGLLYDPQCVPLRSAGINVPNLLYRDGLNETLDWMRRHHLRWMRVFATGHALGPERAPRDASAAITALQRLLTRVEAFNAAHDPSESIYVLVALTDYYPPSVPGDRHAFDHPTFREVPILPAPWYRAGLRRFDFAQEHGMGTLDGLPNYEVFFKPWVEAIVPSVADSPALLGWQVGNELKARNSPRNGISPDQAYDWYLDFTRDMVDTIRALDRQHLIFMGAQYIAELVDWEYRPRGDPIPELVPTYRNLVRRALDACGSHCWNVWSLTGYDFNLYTIDDAMAIAQAGVASTIAEYGFTLGTEREMRERFGSDRPAALRRGLDRAWLDLDGRRHERQWGVTELIERARLAGIAPWGSPVPGAEAAFDQDSRRGITSAPDEAGQWGAWRDIAFQLEAANRAAGPSPACLAFSGGWSAPPPAPPVPHDARYFEETGFRVDHDLFWDYFEAIGGVDTFGFPVSRPFTLLGCTTQLFQWQLFQQCPESGVRMMESLAPNPETVFQIDFGTVPADWLEAIMTARGLPPDVAPQAEKSPFSGQYCPGNPRWLCRPEALPGTDLTFAFEP
jgi:hypothetical protein